MDAAARPLPALSTALSPPDVQERPPALLSTALRWTLPHGPDASNGLRAESAGYTPSGMWKRMESMVSQTTATRAEVRKRAREEEAKATGGGGGGGGGGKGRGKGKGGGGGGGGGQPLFPDGFQGHKSYGLALAWLDRGVGTVPPHNGQSGRLGGAMAGPSWAPQAAF